MFKARDDYIYIAEPTQLHVRNLTSNKHFVLPMLGGKLFAHKNQICRFSGDTSKVNIDLASSFALNFSQIGMVHLIIKGAAFLKLANKFTIIIAQHNLAFQCKIKEIAIIRPFPKLVIARTCHCIVETPNQRLYAMGGVCSVTGKTLDSIETYSVTAKVWELVNLKLPIALKKMSVVSLPEGILCFGGSESEKASRNCFVISDNKII